MGNSLPTYRQLGRSGLFVSPLALGAMSFGEEWGWGANESDSRAIIDRYLEAGGNFIDTANIYTNGTSERILAKALAGRRDRVVLATKGTLNFSVPDPNAGGNSRVSLTRAIDESLARLGTDWIDLYWVHVWDGVTPIEETMRALDDARRAGKIRYVGVSNYPARKIVEWQMLAERHGAVPIVAAQFEYNLIERNIEIEHVDAFAQFGIGQVPWGPLAQGVLTGRYTRESRKPSDAKRSGNSSQQARLTDRTFAVLDVLGSVARELNSNHARVALAWLLGRPTVVSPIVGCRTVEQWDDLLQATSLVLPPALRAKLDEVSYVEPPYPWSFVLPDRANKGVRGGVSIEPWK